LYLSPNKTLEKTVAYSALVTFPFGLNSFNGVPSALIHMILYAYAVWMKSAKSPRDSFTSA
jgi:hypothetical protein